MFELHNGSPIPESERQVLMELDEPTMVDRLLNMMTPQAIETFEHFALQLQLIVSSTTRVRRALEDNDNDAVEASMEASDSTGITQQILKQAVVAAGIEVAELKGRYDSWAKNTENRVGRLAKSSDEAQRAQTQLLAVQAQLDAFGGSQNAKAKKVLMGVAGGQDKALKASVFGSWNGWVQKVKGEKDIRDKFEQQIANAENKLIEYKQKQMSNVTGVLNRKAAESEGGLKGFVFAAWIQDIADRKKEAEMQAEMAAVQGKLQSYKSAQAENTKKVMTRMSAGSDANLVNLCWQAWLTFLQDYKKDKEMEDKVKAAEKQVQDFLKKKSDEAKGVLDRMSGASDSGLLSNVVKAWVGLIKEEKEAREMEEMMAGGNSKFSSLNQRRSGQGRDGPGEPYAGVPLHDEVLRRLGRRRQDGDHPRLVWHKDRAQEGPAPESAADVPAVCYAVGAGALPADGEVWRTLHQAVQGLARGGRGRERRVSARTRVGEQRPPKAGRPPFAGRPGAVPLFAWGRLYNLGGQRWG